MKFLLISPKNRTVYNFRGDLIKKIISLGHEVTVTGPDRIDIEKITALGVNFIEIPMNKTGTNIVSDLFYCFNLYKAIKKERPDITLGYTIKPVVYGGLAAKLAKVKNINAMITGGGYTFTSKKLKARLLGILVKILYKLSFGVSNRIIFQNWDDLEEFCNKKLVKREKCFVVNGSGVNMDKFKKSPLPEEASFFMLSRLLKSKGVLEYLQAAKLVKVKYPDVKFYLLGKFENSMQDAVAEDLIRRYIDDGTVELFSETDDVRPYYKQCSVYVLPSYREGTPRTVLEAMSMGRPIITTDTNGCRETVMDGVNGYIVPVGDCEKLAERMIMLIENKELIKKMGEESRKYCREKFEVGKVNEDMCRYMNI